MARGKLIDFEMRRPFRRADGIAAGVDPAALRGPNFTRIFHGVYVHVSVAHHPLMRVQAALVLHPPGAFASHTSAAKVYGVPLPVIVEEHVSVFAQQDRRRRPGIVHHVVSAGTPVAYERGVPVSEPAAMFVELAELLNLVELVIVGDDLVRRRRTTPEKLVAYCAASGSAAALRAAGYVRRDVDSAMETRLRMLIVLAGLPEPKVNHKVYDESGRLRYRFDLSYPDLKVVVEYDGRQHREDLDQWDHDTVRRDWFDREGWLLVPVFSRGVFRRPDLTLERVVEKLRSRGAKLPRRLSDEWRVYFPVRP